MQNNNLFNKLKELGAGEFAHLNGNLITHLTGTHDLLEDWGANSILCTAGLYHAAYGTAGYNSQLVPHEHRNAIKSLLGDDAEIIVYDYCACDRDFLWPQIGTVDRPIFRNRFTGEMYHVGRAWLETFCELTVANELEIAMHSDDFINKYGPGLRDLFHRMKPYLTTAAFKAFCGVLCRDDY